MVLGEREKKSPGNPFSSSLETFSLPCFFKLLMKRVPRMVWRRFLVFQAFLIWQGGFVFYAAVVVPIGTDQLGSALAQGRITQHVTHALNVFGLLWHLLYAWELLASSDPHRRRARLRFVLWCFSIVFLGGLVLIHRELDSIIDDSPDKIVERVLFARWHIAYLWLTTMHWLMALAQSVLTIQAWHAERGSDRSPPSVAGSSGSREA